MNRKRISFCLVLMLLCGMFTSVFAEEKPVLYTGKTSRGCYLLAETDLKAERLANIPKGKRISILDFDPLWLEVTWDGIHGYVLRENMDDTAFKTVDEVNTPPYGTLRFGYTATISEDTDVYSGKGEGEVLYSLHPGARVALIGFEDGWGKLICKRQYAYIDSRCMTEVFAVDSRLSNPGTKQPIAAYASFYNIAETESNIGRMINLQVACDRMEAMIFRTGDQLNFNDQVGPYTIKNGYQPAPVLVNGTTKLGYGGGTCQVSSTLYNTVLQLPGVSIIQRRAHGAAGAAYLPHGMDAAVGGKTINFRFRNDYSYPIRIEGHVQDGVLFIAIYRAEGQ